MHMFEIVPKTATPLLYGTVAPKFGQSGGGAELEFKVALPSGSVVYKGTKPIW
jgi:hypothetical protein